MLVFFFQAEDGIRDGHVTGVQTCALPISWDQPITVKESVYAQSLTDRFVKGMLTGPVTILNWSFVHDTTQRYDIMQQIGLALQKESHALDQNDIQINQQDEPPLREDLP